MGNKNRSNVLLVEILIAVLFFMLSATVLVRVFATARNMTVRSSAGGQALIEAQNVAEALYAADDPDALLESLNFSQSHGTWTRDDGSYSLYVSTTTTPTEAGELFQAEIRAFYLTRDAGAARPVSEEFFSLSVTRYKEAKS